MSHAYPDQRADIVARVGLDAPLWIQYFRYWGDIFTGDFGFSFRSSRPIVDMIWNGSGRFCIHRPVAGGVGRCRVLLGALSLGGGTKAT